jgi:hypothetical protein
MGMGYGANFVDTVSEDFVKKVVGEKLFNNFLKACEAIEPYEITMLFGQGDYETVKEGEEHFEVCTLYAKILSIFEKKTGLGLFYDYHDASSDGDRYDDVDGAFWGVTGAYTLSKAGKKNKEHIERKFYVTFG